SIVGVCRNLVIPIIAAMAELYGYETVEGEGARGLEPEIEGAISHSIVVRRERNPRNRLLCLRIHGAVCKICGVDPGMLYGEAGNIIEVHHLEPLSLVESPRPYDPSTDLI